MTQMQTQDERSWRLRALPSTLLGLIFTVISLTQTAGVAAQGASKPGTIKGQVLVADSTGSAYVPGTTLVLNGPETFKAESDTNGAFSFPSVAPGTYVIQANAPGLEGQLSVTVVPGQVAEVSVKLELAATTSSVTVSAHGGPSL